MNEIYSHLKLIANDLTIVKPDRSFERERFAARDKRTVKDITNNRRNRYLELKSTALEGV